MPGAVGDHLRTPLSSLTTEPPFRFVTRRECDPW
jgi:hypothetical protein